MYKKGFFLAIFVHVNGTKLSHLKYDDNGKHLLTWDKDFIFITNCIFRKKKPKAYKEKIEKLIF